MASRLLARSKTLALTLTPLARTPLHPSFSSTSPIASTSSQALRCLHSLTSVARPRPSDSSSAVPTSPAVSSILGPAKQNFAYEKTLPRWFCVKAQDAPISQVYQSPENKEIIKASSGTEGGVIQPASHSNEKEVTCFSPLEASSTKTRGLGKESLKIKRFELSQKITYALIPALILVSKSSLTTSLLIFSVYWQIYGYFKEILLDYVHQDVTRTWVLVYLKVLLLILAKDTILNFGLV